MWVLGLDLSGKLTNQDLAARSDDDFWFADGPTGGRFGQHRAAYPGKLEQGWQEMRGACKVDLPLSPP